MPRSLKNAYAVLGVDESINDVDLKKLTAN